MQPNNAKYNKQKYTEIQQIKQIYNIIKMNSWLNIYT